MDFREAGKLLLVAGAIMAVVGAALLMWGNVPFLGKLPGDISIKRENIRIFFPLTTSIIVSLLLTAVLWLVSHFRGR